MKTITVILVIAVGGICFSFSSRQKKAYNSLYTADISAFKEEENSLLKTIQAADLNSDKEQILEHIHSTRLKLKSIDFWFRYFEPTAYKKINGPQAVEWETEVYEKQAGPYRKEGAGLSLAEMALDDPTTTKDSLLHLINSAINATKTFEADSITRQLETYDHFFLANRLFLLNLAAIYTTGFECPDTSNVIIELRSLLHSVKDIYETFNHTFSSTPLSYAYMRIYNEMISFADNQPVTYSNFNHFLFLRAYVNVLYGFNQGFIRSYSVVSKNENDFSLNNLSNSIFSKSLYSAQNAKGVYSLVEDSSVLSQINDVGKDLFYDPILSGNNKRSCASCHKSTEYFADTAVQTALQFDQIDKLTRNTPSLINVIYNHLIMLDGKHPSLQSQADGVMTNHIEMDGNEKVLLEKVLSCRKYKTVFKNLLRYTPGEKEISFNHVVAAITYYYSQFSDYTSPFDEAMDYRQETFDEDARNGFNLFMSKALCATCHFVPQFNGVKPPYIGSEFEVLGVPSDTTYKKLDADKGRYDINPAAEMLHAFRTGSLRNIEYTKPYMHNGVFTTLNQVIDFYDGGGGAGRHLDVSNQTLSSDSLKLTPVEKKQLLAFLHSLNENIIFEPPPASLPTSSHKEWNGRKVGGEY